MKSLIIAFTLVLLLGGCDSIKEMVKEQENAQAYIKKNHGWDSQVGFNYSNGALVNVTLHLNSSEVGGKTIAELEEIAINMVSNTFEKNAEAIYIQLAIQSE